MHDALTRATFAYATILFAVLFAPQVGIEKHISDGFRLISLFPDVVTLVLMCVVLWLAVRQAAHGQGEDVFARGFARGVAVSVIGAALYAIGLSFVAPVVFTQRAFAWETVLGSLVVVAAVGSALSAFFASRFSRAAARKPS